MASDPVSLLTQAEAEAKLASRITGQKNSYAKDNPTEYASVMAYWNGGSRPGGSLTHMGNLLVGIEDALQALSASPPLPPNVSESDATQVVS